MVMEPIVYYLKNPLLFIETLVRKFMSWLPDKAYLSIIYRCRMGSWINWNNPQTFTQFLQWLKLYDRKTEYSSMVDKVEVKKLVTDKIGGQYVVATLAVWNHVEDIDLSILPDKFVLKTSHGGGDGEL